VDPKHRSLGTFVAEEIVKPLGVEFWVGLPEQHESRVSPMIAAAPPEDPAVLQMMIDMMGPGTNAFRALYLEGAFFPQPHQQSPFNTRAVHAAEIPAANGIGTAAALAKIYAATLAPVDGTQLISDATRERARTTVTPEGEADACLVLPSTFGMGFMTTGFMSPYMGRGCFGHPGAGGSVAFASPEDEVAFAFVMNQMDNNLANDLRTINLTSAVRSVIG
jgi:CubicO group peptidase (beta-lactamase class C family)